ncbi:MAG: hypothetical protein GY786_07445, partial [Proteobacteria bacterium]|nr:hypothetical protein [Pseudomonadota bacterium]
MEIIRESEGTAEDNAPLFLKLYEEKNGETRSIKNALEKLAKDAAHLKEKNDQREILLSYKSDPYPDEKIELNITEDAINKLIENDLNFSIFMEKAENDLEFLKLLKGYDKARYGTKLLSNENGNRLNLEVSPLFFNIESLKEANKLGIKTWVDLDPAFEPDIAHKIVRELYQVVDQWKLNGTKFEITEECKSDWGKFEKNSIGLLESLGIEPSWTESVIPT